MPAVRVICSTLCLVLILHETLQPAYCESIMERDLKISYSQGKILDKFKERVLPMLKEDYMKDDIYLIRWLRAKDFNINEAQKMLTNNLRWRKENRIEDLDKEDWSYFEDEFAYSLETTDYENKPILTIDSQTWDVRSAVLSGRRDQLMRWMIKMLEDSTRKVRQLQNEGKNVTRWGMIYDLGYFNLVQSGCLSCLPVYAAFVTNYETYYPQTVDKITLVNTPSVFDIVLRFIRPVLSSETGKAIRVLGTNKAEWQQVLRSEIPKQKLSKQYGGIRPNEFE